MWHELIDKDHPQIIIEPVADLLTGLKKLSFGSVDAMVANLATATFYIEKAGITNLHVAGETGYFGRYALAVRKDCGQLNGILEKGLAAITEEERNEIQKRWIGLKGKSLFDNRAFWVSFLTSISVVLGIMILGWNWLLRKRVAAQTADLRTELLQRIRAENAHQQSEQCYRTLFESASDAIFMMAGEHFIDCNNAASRMFGCSREFS